MTAFSSINHPHWVGFNSLFSALEKASSVKASYPPHNIVRVTPDHHLIELAVAGFKEEDISIDVKENTLTIKGSRKDEREYSYKGISTRDFEQDFILAEYVEVKEATYENGILQISLIRKLPEEKKPRSIKIRS